MMQVARQQEPPDIRDGMQRAMPSTESPNMVGMANDNAMGGVYHDMKKQIEVGETSINNMMSAIANKTLEALSTPPRATRLTAIPTGSAKTCTTKKCF